MLERYSGSGAFGETAALHVCGHRIGETLEKVCIHTIIHASMNLCIYVYTHLFIYS